MLLTQLLASFQSLPQLPTNKSVPSGGESHVCGLVYVLGPQGLSNELSCEAGSFSCCHNSHRCIDPEVLRLYFPTLEPWVARSVSLPSCSSWFIHNECGNNHSISHHLTRLILQPQPCCASFPPWLPISTLSTRLDECFFFNSLVFQLPYSSIFWQFWFFKNILFIYF